MYTEPVGILVDAPPEQGWRLVCHTCGHRFDKSTAVALKDACCAMQRVFIHDLTKPCHLCVGP